MPTAIFMPRLDKDMERGIIIAWHCAEGDSVAKGDVLFDVETDKAAVEVEAPDAGTLHHILFAAGETAPVDNPVAWLYAEGETVGPRPAAAAPAAAPKDSTATPVEPPAAVPTEAPRQATGEARPAAGRLTATPAARQAAAEQGLRLADVPGTGPGGRIQLSDILMAAADAPAPAFPGAQPPGPPLAFETQGGALSVLRSGRGEALPLVMIHGFLADASIWTRLEKPLAQSRRIHRIELPCHGRSPRRRYRSFNDLAADLRQAFDGLDLESCHVVGHSLGGALALALADTRPRQCASLTLIAPAGLGPEINGAAILGMCQATRSESLGPWLRLLTGDPDAVGWAYVQAAAAARSDPALRAAQLALAEVLFPDGVQAFDLSAALRRVEMPTRILWGKADRIIPWKHALEAPGRVSLNLFDNVGHMPQYEIPDELAALLKTLP